MKKLEWTMSLYDEEKKRVRRHGRRLYAEIKENEGKINVSFTAQFKKPADGPNVVYIGFYDTRSRDLFQSTHTEAFSSTQEAVKAVHACNRRFQPARKITSVNPKPPRFPGQGGNLQ